MVRGWEFFTLRFSLKRDHTADPRVRKKIYPALWWTPGHLSLHVCPYKLFQKTFRYDLEDRSLKLATISPLSLAPSLLNMILTLSQCFRKFPPLYCCRELLHQEGRSLRKRFCGLVHSLYPAPRTLPASQETFIE